MNPSILVLGAGLAGVSTAFELKHLGFNVTLVDQDDVPMNRASRRNEGKIHLGLIFAADATGNTASTQLRGALTFAPLLRRWFGDGMDSIPLSTPFTYLVAPDSLFTPTQLAQHYASLATRARQFQIEHPDWHYFGRQLGDLTRRLEPDEIAQWFDPGQVRAAFHTEELAIDPDTLADFVIDALRSDPQIAFKGGHEVQGIARKGSGFVVSGVTQGEPFALDADIVVNTTWENRFALDQTVGLSHRPGWLHRLKYRVIARLPEGLAAAPSVTMVLGRYGDVVIRPDRTAYLSWYPLGLRGWTQALAPPADWGGPCRGDVGPEEAVFAEGVVEAIGRWFPCIAQSLPERIDAGAIVAYGATDVDDPASRLHDRTAIGITHVEGFFSMDPGKLTTAPWFGKQTAEAVAGYLGSRK